MNIDIALAGTPTLAEGALWSWREQELIWVDILGGTLNRFDPATGKNRAHTLPSLVGTAVPRTDGDFQVAVREGFARSDPVNGALSELVTPAGHDAVTMRFNDGKCDPAGRFLAGTMSLVGAPHAGALYALEAGGHARTLLTGVSISNGLAWSWDGSILYYIDTPTRCVAAFDYDLAHGTLHHRRVAIEVPAALGYPDGMTIDAEGMLWIALWGGSAVTRWNPINGRLLATHPLPASQITSCAFGGSKLDTLFVTSARADLSAEQLAAEPLAGALFALDPGVTGVSSFAFAH
ncbi:SMP-30/gluconolactonase/LRE family protein [Oleiharenicola lentus]|uniref:SMP-30/gluconolactonase/LRE family protein n=1 Tax=Oleiharenicola lentus TaxID=2508720 RepID=UPI003F673294